jgi:hypothetical protein
LSIAVARLPAKAAGEQLGAIEVDVAAQRATRHSFDDTNIFSGSVRVSFSEWHLAANWLQKDWRKVDEYLFKFEEALPALLPACVLIEMSD